MQIYDFTVLELRSPKSKVLAGIPSGDSRGKYVSLPFSTSKGHLHPLRGAPSFIFKASRVPFSSSFPLAVPTLPSSIVISLVTVTLLLLFYNDLLCLH